MTLEKQEVIDKIEVLEDGQIQIRKATRILEDGEVISESFHRHVISPNHEDITDQDEKVQTVANAVWTDEVKAAYVKSVEKHKQD